MDINGWQTQTRDWWTESGIIELRNNGRAAGECIIPFNTLRVFFYDLFLIDPNTVT